MIIDSHAHLFSSKIIANVSARAGLVKELDLDIGSAPGRCTPDALRREIAMASVSACLVLPTASAKDVARVNASFRHLERNNEFLVSAGTLHPHYPENRAVLEQLEQQGTKAIKLCSFSQGFGLEEEATIKLFELIREFNTRGERSFFVVLDTFYKADTYFDSPSEHITTPARLGRLVAGFPEIDFVAAHMGGLAAPFEETCEHLVPSENLYLETSNAAHTLMQEEFVRLLKRHGSGHILFGTDWPWFSHADEIDRIGGLLEIAGFRGEDRERVFSKNIARLLAVNRR
jgi:predicted TIM-barrel fold metal-dependent hydrolase